MARRHRRPDTHLRNRPAAPRYARPRIEQLEDRLVLSVRPISLADPSYYGLSGDGPSLGPSGNLFGPSVSADGQLAVFTSSADNLVTNDTNGSTRDVFVRNLTTGATTLVSVNAAGTGSGDGASYDARISPDGRYVVFYSSAADLVSQTVSNPGQVYLRDLQTGTTTLVSANQAGTDGAVAPLFDDLAPVLSPDGRYVVFEGLGDSALVSGGVNPDSDYLYLRDLQTNTTRVIDSHPETTSGTLAGAAFSGNSRYLVFASSFAETAGDTNGVTDVYRYDVAAGTVTLVSTNLTGAGSANGTSDFGPVNNNSLNSQGLSPVSADGRFVVFASDATDLQIAGTAGIYVKDLQNGTVTQVDTARPNTRPVISADGRYVVFESGNGALTGLGTGGHVQVFIKDLQGGSVRLVSGNSAGTAPADADATLCAVIADGQLVVFRSAAANLAGVPTGGTDNLYLRDVRAGTTRLISANQAGTAGGDGASQVTIPLYGTDLVALTPDGQHVLYTSDADDLVAGDANRHSDVFAYATAAGTNALVSQRDPSLPAAILGDGDSFLDDVSADGRYVVFRSWGASNLTPTPPLRAGNDNVYVHDNLTGATTLVSANAAGTGDGNGQSGLTTRSRISADGRFVFFWSTATDLTAGVTGSAGGDLYVRDLQAGVTRLVTVNAAGTGGADSNTQAPVAISANGRYVLFLSNATNLVAGVAFTHSSTNLYWRDLQTGSTRLVSADAAGTGDADQGVLDGVFSSDGRYVAFTSLATNLTAQATNGFCNVFFRDMQGGGTRLLSVNQAGTGGGGDSGLTYTQEGLSISADGRYVAFSSTALDLVAGTTQTGNVFVRDTVANATRLVTLNAAGTQDVGRSGNPVLSADGRFVAFFSDATNLVAGLTTHFGGNVFLRDLQTNTTQLVSINAAGTDGNDVDNQTYDAFNGPSLAISADGRFVAFRDRATDLVANFQGPGLGNAYVRDTQTGTTILVSRNVAGTGGLAGQATSPFNDNAGDIVLSADGSWVGFDTPLANLYLGDTNRAYDVYGSTISVGTAAVRGQVFSDANGNGARDAGESGRAGMLVYLDADGNGRLDPGEVTAQTDAGGNYAFTGLTAGTYLVRQSLPANFQQTLPGGGAGIPVTLANGQNLTGQDFGDEILTPDLAVTTASADPAGSAGRPLALTWTVQNGGGAAAAGGWQDAIYLSTKPTLDAGATLLTTVVHTGGLAAGASYTVNQSVDLPGALPGTYFVIVQTDRRAQVADAGRGNNQAASAAVAVTIPTLALDTPTTDGFTAVGQDRYFQITVAAGQALRFVVNSAAPTGQVDLYARAGALPTPADFDAAGQAAGQPGQVAAVPTTGAATYYVLVHATSGAAAGAAFTLTARTETFGLDTIGPRSGGNTGRVTVKLTGALFTPATQARLIRGGTTLTAVATSLFDASTLYATFDLTGQAFGTYDVQVQDGARTATLAGAFTVVAGVSAPLTITVTVPSAFREGRETPIVVDYANPGNVDVMAPVLALTGDAGKVILRLPEQAGYAGLDANKILFLATSPDGPAGVLRAGAKGRQVFYCTSITDMGHDPENFTVTGYDDLNQQVDWAAQETALRPAGVDPAAWHVVWTRYIGAVGGTLGALNARLADRASYLSQFGIRTGDVARLYAAELRQADDSQLALGGVGATDVSLAAPGLPLTFSRQTLPTISGHYYQGILGPGWVSNWDLRLTDTGAEVQIGTPQLPRRFILQGDGTTYLGLSGDAAVLTRRTTGTVGGGGTFVVDYTLAEADGTKRVFSAQGLLQSITDAHGNQITLSYTGGRLTRLTHSDGDFLQLTYNGAGRLSRVTDQTGRAVTYGYNAAGQLTAVTTVAGTTTYAYAPGGNPAVANALTAITQPDGSDEVFTYDVQGRLTGRRNADGTGTLTVAYDAFGGLTLTDATGARSFLDTNDAGEAVRFIDPLGHTTRWSYNAQFRLTQEVAADGTATSYAYDAAGNLAAAIDALGRRTAYTVDPVTRQLTGYQDAAGHLTRYGHDAQGNLRSITYANGSQEQFTYDPLGDLTEALNRRGHATDYAYNAEGQVTQATFADGSRVTYGYDAHGNLTTAADGTGTTVLTYDGADRLTRITYPGGRSLAFTYDANGRRASSVDQTGFTVRYAYDAAGRLAGLRDGNNALIVHYTYDALGRLTRKDLGNGTFTTFAYDAGGELLTLANHAPDGSVSSQFAYTYNAVGQVTGVTSLDGTTTLAYDAVGQLTEVDLPGGRTIRYAFDAVGNRTSVTDNGVTMTYTANDLNEITSAGGITFSYDADGNLIAQTDSSGTTTYAFNDLNQLVGQAGPDGTFSYQFDPLGQFAAATRNGVRTDYLVDPAGQGDVVGEFGPGGAAVAHYTQGLGLVSRVAPGGAAYYDFDGQTNAVALTDATGAAVNRYRYLPFGQMTAVAQALANPFTFAGQFGVQALVGNTYLMRARTYDAAVGQFRSPDPLGLNAGDPNIRRYVGNNPLTFIDPSGLARCPNNAGDLSTLTGFGGVANALGQGIFDVANGAAKGTPLGNAIPKFTYSRFGGAGLNGAAAARGVLTTLGGVLAVYGEEATGEAIGYDVAHTGDYNRAAANTLAAAIGLASFVPVLGAPAGIASAVIGANADAIADWLDKQDWNPLNRRGPDGHSQGTNACDPNTLTGPGGFGPQQFVAPAATFPFLISFENEEDASAPAQEVVITTQLDPNLDWSTFTVGNFGFGPLNLTVPQGVKAYRTRVAYHNPDGSPLDVDVSVTINQETGVVTWAFRSVDPATGALPTDAFAGFLPPDDAMENGDGYVTYFVQPRADLPTGTVINAQASIVFDVNAPVLTNVHTNTIDNGAPTATVQALPAFRPATFTVTWSGSDDANGSGVAAYNVFVSDNGGAFTAWRTATTQTSAAFTGVDGHTYRFYALAADNAGNAEIATGAAEAQATVDAAPPASTVAGLPARETTPTFTVNWSGADGTGSGLAFYDVFVATNGGAFTLWQNHTTQTSAAFTGTLGSTYGFYSVATDNVGNRQATPAAAQATTAVGAPVPPSFTTAKLLPTAAGAVLVLTGDSGANDLILNQTGPGRFQVLTGGSGATRVNGQLGAQTFTGVVSVVANLAGGDDTFTVNTTAQPLALAGNLFVTGSGGAKTVTVSNAAIGNGLQVTVPGTRATVTLTGVTVANALFVTAPTAGPAAVALTNVTVGLGGTQILTGAGADTVSLANSTFRGTFVALTGAGDDVVNLQTQAGTTAFNGGVVVNLGAGNNTLNLAPAADDVVILAGRPFSLNGLTTAALFHGGGPGLNRRSASPGLTVRSPLPPLFLLFP